MKYLFLYILLFAFTSKSQDLNTLSDFHYSLPALYTANCSWGGPDLYPIGFNQEGKFAYFIEYPDWSSDPDGNGDGMTYTFNIINLKNDNVVYQRNFSERGMNQSSVPIINILNRNNIHINKISINEKIIKKETISDGWADGDWITEYYNINIKGEIYKINNTTSWEYKGQWLQDSINNSDSPCIMNELSEISSGISISTNNGLEKNIWEGDKSLEYLGYIQSNLENRIVLIFISCGCIEDEFDYPYGQDLYLIGCSLKPTTFK